MVGRSAQRSGLDGFYEWDTLDLRIERLRTELVGLLTSVWGFGADCVSGGSDFEVLEGIVSGWLRALSPWPLPCPQGRGPRDSTGLLLRLSHGSRDFYIEPVSTGGTAVPFTAEVRALGSSPDGVLRPRT